MTCLLCSHGAMGHKSDTTANATRRAMARAGAICCLLSPNAASFYAFDRTCPKFTEADPETAQSRTAWAATRKESIS